MADHKQSMDISPPAGWPKDAKNHRLENEIVIIKELHEMYAFYNKETCKPTNKRMSKFLENVKIDYHVQAHLLTFLLLKKNVDSVMRQGL